MTFEERPLNRCVMPSSGCRQAGKQSFATRSNRLTNRAIISGSTEPATNCAEATYAADAKLGLMIASLPTAGLRSYENVPRAARISESAVLNVVDREGLDVKVRGVPHWARVR